MGCCALRQHQAFEVHSMDTAPLAPHIAVSLRLTVRYRKHLCASSAAHSGEPPAHRSGIANTFCASGAAHSGERPAYRSGIVDTFAPLAPHIAVSLRLTGSCYLKNPAPPAPSSV